MTRAHCILALHYNIHSSLFAQRERALPCLGQYHFVYSVLLYSAGILHISITTMFCVQNPTNPTVQKYYQLNLFKLCVSGILLL